MRNVNSLVNKTDKLAAKWGIQRSTECSLMGFTEIQLMLICWERKQEPKAKWKVQRQDSRTFFYQQQVVQPRVCDCKQDLPLRYQTVACKSLTVCHADGVLARYYYWCWCLHSFMGACRDCVRQYSAWFAFYPTVNSPTRNNTTSDLVYANMMNANRITPWPH